MTQESRPSANPPEEWDGDFEATEIEVKSVVYTALSLIGFFLLLVVVLFICF